MRLLRRVESEVRSWYLTSAREENFFGEMSCFISMSSQAVNFPP